MQCASCRITVIACPAPLAGELPPCELPPCELPPGELPPGELPPCGPLDAATLHPAAAPAIQTLIRVIAIVRLIWASLESG